jgi:2-dehydro-3-deoxyphosphogluconate aldolase/(4S)-4-hydroxy-2-oxoglutarate aldolase
MKQSLLDLVPVIPVIVIDHVGDAVPLARALVGGGVPIIEVTLRTPVALHAIRRIAAEVPDIVVGAGTVVEPDQAKQATDAGARFLVSPGSTPHLLDAMHDTGLPHLPGAGTVSEVLALLERGYSEMKLFPAEASGGTAFLDAIASPLPQARFCPTGGISASNAAAYLSLPNVGCVGGSWLTPRETVASGNWHRVEQLARTAAELRHAT